jgi:hypothetical protein
VVGSTTACVVSLVPSLQTAIGVNVGDSGLLVFRKAKANPDPNAAPPSPPRYEVGRAFPCLLCFGAGDAHKMTWCCIQKLCTESGDSQ